MRRLDDRPKRTTVVGPFLADAGRGKLAGIGHDRVFEGPSTVLLGVGSRNIGSRVVAARREIAARQPADGTEESQAELAPEPSPFLALDYLVLAQASREKGEAAFRGGAAPRV